MLLDDDWSGGGEEGHVTTTDDVTEGQLWLSGQ